MLNMGFVRFEIDLFEFVAFAQFWDHFVMEAFAYGGHLSEMDLIGLGIIFLFLQLVFEEWNTLVESLNLVVFLVFSELGSHVVGLARLVVDVVHLEDGMGL